MKGYICYTDGACSGNPGPGGWSYIIKYGEKIKSNAGFVSDTTNNRMELFAAMNAIKFFLKISKDSNVLHIHSDSAYVVNAFNKGWLNSWVVNGYKKTNGDNITNRDLWEEMVKLQIKAKSKAKAINFIKVKGHSGDELNEKVDSLAREQIKLNN